MKLGMLSLRNQSLLLALGLKKQFQGKRQRIRKAFYDKNRDNECEIQDNEAQFKINVFNVTLDRVHLVK